MSSRAARSRRAARARARANIALAKYWGKSDDALNLPAVPSVSITLDPLVTETRVEFDASLEDDTFELDGVAADPGERARVVAMLDEVRALAGLSERARVESRNHFPTAAGLASSASGFAALAGACSMAAGLDESLETLSARARRASASAARSIWGGFVALSAGAPGDDALCARPIAGPEHWDLRVVVAVTAIGRKSIASRRGMSESRDTSPYWRAWVESSSGLAAGIEEAVAARDLARLVPRVEQSFHAMHAVAMTASPAILYWQPGSVAALATLARLRAEGVLVAPTMDAGPHVKAVCAAADVERVQRALDATEGVVRTLVARPGPGIELEAAE
jgi:diphosphomevalonate decarboxylase